MRDQTTIRTKFAATAALTAALFAAGAADAQDKPKVPKWRIDPYTKNDPKLMTALGYVSYGPFEFGPVSSEEVDKFLSYDQFLWVETAHFRIGSSLQNWVVPFEPDTKAKLRGELTRLAEKLPPGRINPKSTNIDPWLRLHLTALRMEDLYAEMSQLLGVKDEQFPAGPSSVVRGEGRFMGYGPYLGQQGKYLILLPDKGSTYVDYLKRWIGRTAMFGQRWNFKEQGSLFYGVAADMEEGRLKHDTALHCNLAFNISHNLIDGFRNYSYDLPVWIKEGLGHWFERRVHIKWNTFDQNEGGLADKKPLYNWKPYMRQLFSGSKFTPLSEAMTWRDYNQINFNDHVALWSRWDFLMSVDDAPAKFSAFMFEVKGRVTEDWFPDQSDLVGATRDALSKVYGMTPLSFDEKWKEWVLKTYPTQ